MKRTAPALLAAWLALSAAACARPVQEEDDSDPALKARVETVLRGRADINLQYVSVDATSGVITISGLVPSREQSILVSQLVRRVPGVEQVLNNLVVQE